MHGRPNDERRRGLAADLRAGLLDRRAGHRRVRPRRRHGRGQAQHHRRWAARRDHARARATAPVTIALPLTLAILDGMSISVGDEIYILPLGFVVESLQPRAEPTSRRSPAAGAWSRCAANTCRWSRCTQVFDVERRRAGARPQGIVVDPADRRAQRVALLVDELVGQQQVVVKNLESNYRKVPGISGATILGDGGVALIVDVGGAGREYAQRAARHAFHDAGTSRPRPSPPYRTHPQLLESERGRTQSIDRATPTRQHPTPRRRPTDAGGQRIPRLHARRRGIRHRHPEGAGNPRLRNGDPHRQRAASSSRA